LDWIKYDRALATSKETTWLRFDSSVASDMADNFPLTIIDGRANEAMLATAFYEDSTVPALDSFDINMNTGHLVLSFSETVQRSTLTMGRLHLHVSSLAVSSFVFTTTSFTQSDDGTELDVVISDDDLNEIKRLPQLAIDATTTVLSLDLGAVKDMNNNEIMALASEQCTTFTQDSTDPKLESYDLDMTNGILTMTFSETVKASTFEVTSATLRVGEHVAGSGDGMEFVESVAVPIRSTSTPVFSYADGLVMGITLSVEDLNLIKKETELAISKETTFVSIETVLVEDMNRNKVESIEAQRVLNYDQDEREPTLDSFDLDMSTRVLTLHFSETVASASTLDVTQLTLVPTTGSSLTDGVTLSDTSVNKSPTEDSHIVVIHISVADANKMKLLPALAQDAASTSLAFTASTIDDMNGNDLEVGALDVTASKFVADLVAPVPESFAIDMDKGIIYVTFDEPIDAESLQATHITLHAGDAGSVLEGEYAGFKDAAATYKLLTGDSIAADAVTLEVQIEEQELHEIKFLRMFTRAGDAVLSLANGVVTDTATAASTSVVKMLSDPTFTVDSTAPTLVSFTFDLTRAMFHMTFSEPVNTLTVEATTITLQSVGSRSSLDALDVATRTHTITSAMICDSCQSSDGLSVDLEISEHDLEALKFKTDLFTSETNSYISLTEGLIKDMAGVKAAVISVENAQVASEFIDDSIAPTVTTFDLDMTTETLVISFSETVDYGTANLLAISLSSADNVASDNAFGTVSLTVGEVLNKENGPTLSIKLSLADLNKMKSYKIGVSEETTYLTATALAVKDMAGNRLVPLTNGVDAKLVAVYARDRTPPVLSSCALDLTAETLTMKFSETVSSSSLEVEGLRIQEHMVSNGETESFTFQTESVTDDADSPIVVIDISLADMNEIKRLSEWGLADDADSVWCYGVAFIADVFGNEIVTIANTEAVASDGYETDKTDPKLLSFALEMNHIVTEDRLTMGTALLRLSFSETVQFESYVPTELTILGGPNGDPASDVKLTGYYVNVTTTSGTTVAFKLLRSDANAIKKIDALASNVEDTFVSITTSFIKDMYGNEVEEITRGQPLKATTFVIDDRAPELFRFSIDMDEGSMSLTFDETVVGSSLIPDEILLRDHTDPASATAAYNLTGAYGTNGDEQGALWVKEVSDLGVIQRTYAHENSDVIKMYFLKVDLDEIKRLSMCTKDKDCYMTHSERLIYDMQKLDVDGCD